MHTLQTAQCGCMHTCTVSLVLQQPCIRPSVSRSLATFKDDVRGTESLDRAERFFASMSMVQFILLGVEGIGQASIYAGICFVASVVGVVVIERAIRKSGRVSLIVFLVTAIMALSTVIVTCFGALDVWMQYTSGEYMGFKLPC